MPVLCPKLIQRLRRIRLSADGAPERGCARRSVPPAGSQALGRTQTRWTRIMQATAGPSAHPGSSSRRPYPDGPALRVQAPPSCRNGHGRRQGPQPPRAGVACRKARRAQTGRWPRSARSQDTGGGHGSASGRKMALRPLPVNARATALSSRHRSKARRH
jgi:hypothetical protein